MQIDFKATYDTPKGSVVFVRTDGEVAVMYPFADLLAFVADKGLAIVESCEGTGSGNVCDPESYLQNVTSEDITAYIDDKWSEVTEKFFHFKQNGDGK